MRGRCGHSGGHSSTAEMPVGMATGEESFETQKSARRAGQMFRTAHSRCGVEMRCDKHLDVAGTVVMPMVVKACLWLRLLRPPPSRLEPRCLWLFSRPVQPIEEPPSWGSVGLDWALWIPGSSSRRASKAPRSCSRPLTLRSGEVRVWSASSAQTARNRISKPSLYSWASACGATPPRAFPPMVARFRSGKARGLRERERGARGYWKPSEGRWSHWSRWLRTEHSERDRRRPVEWMLLTPIMAAWGVGGGGGTEEEEDGGPEMRRWLRARVCKSAR
ncbi:hypothetical protein CRUP_026849 [Coryphaenoides rupestris]|nr:hypothetical protein CRUP_026849 [Coryphaenoides rupestris]